MHGGFRIHGPKSERNFQCGTRRESLRLNRGTSDATRCGDVAVHRCFLRRGVSLRQGMPEVEVTPMQIDLVTLIALILSVFLLGYLTLTLLFPEKF
jgi:K+-transporting ATPase KdpF subunit